MLQLRRMDTHTRSRRVRVSAAYLLLAILAIPQPMLTATGLRDDAITYRNEGFERQRQGDLQGALMAYQKAAALDPSYPTPLNDVGVLYEQMGQLDDAKRAYEQALVLDPNYLEAHTNLAMLHERLGEKEKAIYHWLKRYQLGRADDPWTARAEERLVALGVLTSYPGLKGLVFTRRRVVEQELKAHEQSVEDFHALSESRDWP